MVVVSLKPNLAYPIDAHDVHPLLRLQLNQGALLTRTQGTVGQLGIRAIQHE